jgi:hypothetical protein
MDTPGDANLPKSDAEHRSTYLIEVIGDMVQVSFFKDYANVGHNFRAAQLLVQDCEDIIAANPSTIFKVLVDISNLGGTIGFLNKETRDLYSKLMDNDRVGNVAFFGVNRFYEVAVKLMIGAMSAHEKVKIFRSKEEALEWLKK